MSALGDLPRIPGVLVGAARELFRGLGVEAAVVRADGSIDVPLLIGNLVREVEVRTSYFPPIKWDIRAAVRGESQAPSLSDRVLEAFKPHILLHTIGGKIETAPWGKPTPGQGETNWQNIKIAGIIAGAGLAALALYAAVKSYKHPWQVLPERTGHTANG